MDTVAPTPMAQTEQAPAPIKTALAPKKSRKLSNALTDQKEARA
jgi:hypothetical protein